MKDIYSFLDELIEMAVKGVQYDRVKGLNAKKMLISLLIEFDFIEIRHGKITATEIGKKLLKLPTD